MAGLVERCPLVAACTVGEEPDPNIGETRSETQGVATCFDSGEKLRRGVSLVDGAEHYVVRASDGTLCYEAVGGFPRHDIHVGTDLVATFEDVRANDLVLVTCAGAAAATTIDLRIPHNRDCDLLPWDPARTCAPRAGCTFGGE